MTSGPGLTEGVSSPHFAAGAHSSLVTWIESFVAPSTGVSQQIVRGELLPPDFSAPHPLASRRHAVSHAARPLDFSDRPTTVAFPVWNGSAYAVLWQFNASAGNLLFQTLVDEDGSAGFASLVAGLDRHTIEGATIVAGVTRLVTTSATEGTPWGLSQRGFWFAP